MIVILNLPIIIKASIIKCRPMGDSWVSVNLTAMGLGKIQNLSLYGVLMGLEIFHGSRFGTAEPSGFVPVAIPKC